MSKINWCRIEHFCEEDTFSPSCTTYIQNNEKKYEGLNIKNPTYLLYIVWGGRLLLFLISKLTDVSPKTLFVSSQADKEICNLLEKNFVRFSMAPFQFQFRRNLTLCLDISIPTIAFVFNFAKTCSVSSKIKWKCSVSKLVNWHMIFLDYA